MANFITRSLTASMILMGVGVVDAFWRLPCQGRSGVARIDPLAQYGEVAHHAHVIHGGNNFGFESDYDDLMASNCTSCAVKQDMSVYWTPGLYFERPNGEMTLVKQVGGMLAYYHLFGDNIETFPPGFRMIAGEASRREFTLPVPDPPKSEWKFKPEQTTESALRQKALGFNCLDYNPERTAEPTLYRHFLPDKAYLDANCPNGIRLELQFPSCWNGEVDSDDHMSHVAYPDLVMLGKCPEGFPKRLVSMLFETIWDTYAFKGEEGRFVLANGDATGYGYHGDFVNAWDPSFLKSAIDTCKNPSGKVEDCPLFELQSEAEQKQCTLTPPDVIADEDCEGPRQGLPGGVSVKGKTDADEGEGEEQDKEDKKDEKQKAKDDSSPDSPAATTTSSPPAGPSPTEVPTLSYSSASPEDDPNAALAPVQSPSTTSTTSTTSLVSLASAEDVQIVAADVASTSEDEQEPEQDAVAPATSTTTTTSPPPPPEEATPSPSFASTTTYVTNGTLMKIYVVHETVSVTADVTEKVTTTAGGAAADTAAPGEQDGYARKKKNKRALHHAHQHLHHHHAAAHRRH